MRFVVSTMLVVLLLGMPVGCVLAGFNPSHACCPSKSASSKCPYDTLDNAKAAKATAVANVPIAIVTEVVTPRPLSVQDLLPEIAESQPDLYVLNRILRI
jgi:hypothetical protein